MLFRSLYRDARGCNGSHGHADALQTPTDIDKRGTEVEHERILASLEALYTKYDRENITWSHLLHKLLKHRYH